MGRIFLGLIFLLVAGLAVVSITSEPENTGGSRGGRAVSVVAKSAKLRGFSDIVEAIGTARASDSVMLTAPVTDTVETIHFADGDVVLAGDPIVDLLATEEQALVAEAQSALKEAQQQYKRIADLVARGNSSKSQLDTQTRAVDEAKARLRAAEARLADRRVTAPFDGMLGFRQVSPGSLVGPQTPIVTLDRIVTINLDFAVPERFLAVLKNDLPVNARIQAYGDKLFNGIVKTVGSRVDPSTRSVTVRAEVKNGDLLIRPGMLMTVRLVAYSWDAVAVPEEAIMPVSGKNYVYRVIDGKSVRTPVELGIRRPGYVEVISGVQAGDVIVTEGGFRLGETPVEVDVTLDDTASAMDAAGEGY